eukprot:c16887_g1_i3.p1 GENE.c16887_g1_i3~~c16887_g1_i3.p1  ORF type:complete len:125 (+),score=25.86 c16887_g1_i3:112-486(+)
MGDWTLLHLAAAFNKPEVTEVLHEFGSDVNQTDKHGHTPMHTAATNGHVEVVQLLYGYGGDVNKANNRGATPLMFASSMGRVSVVRALIGFGANIADKKDGRTARDIAVEKGHAEVVSLLDKVR